MNGTSSRPQIMVYLIAVAGALLIMASLVWIVQKYNRPEPVGTARAAERKKALTEVRASEVEGLKMALVDKEKGKVRLSIQRAMEITLQEYQNPDAARSNMVARAEKASAPPPKAPEQPNQYE